MNRLLVAIIIYTALILSAYIAFCIFIWLNRSEDRLVKGSKYLKMLFDLFTILFIIVCIFLF